MAESGCQWDHRAIQALADACDARDTLIQGLRKAVANPRTEWVDANIIRLLLDRVTARKDSDG